MESPVLRGLLRPEESQLRIIWFASTLSVLVYVGIAFYNANQKETTPPEQFKIMSIILSTLAVGLGIASVVLWRFLPSDRTLQAQLDQEVNPRDLATDAETGRVDEARLAKLESLSPFELKLSAIASRYRTRFVISLALNEAIAVFGLILSMQARSIRPVIPFAVAALILHGLTFPRPEEVLERARNLRRSW